MALTGYSIPTTLTDDAGNTLTSTAVGVTGPGYTGTATSDPTSGIIRLGPLPVGDYTITLGTRSLVVPVIASDADVVAEAVASVPGGGFTPEAYGAVTYATQAAALAGIDSTPAINSMLSAMYAAKGGEASFSAGWYKVAGQIILPNDGGGIFGSGAQLQPDIKWVGQGGHASGQNENGSGGTRLVCTFASATYNNAKIVTRGLGQFAVTDITFIDTTANAVTPFLFTTNTTLKISRCAFLGTTGGTACAQDAIVLGGTLKPLSTGYNDPNSAFQGYGTVIRDNYFNRVRRVVYGRSYCNQVQVTANMFDKGCGTNLVGGACVEFDGSLSGSATADGDNCTNNVVTGNYCHYVGGYAYQVKLKQATRCFIGYNGFVDAGPNAVAGVRMESAVDGSGVTRASTDNMVIGNMDAYGNHLSEDTASTRKNFLIGGGQAQGTILPGNVALTGGGNQIELAAVKFTGNIETTVVGGFSLTVPTYTTGSGFRIVDKAGQTLLQIAETANGTSSFYGPMLFKGNAAGDGTTTVTIGNNSTVSTALLNFNCPASAQNQIQFKRGGVNKWLFYDGGGNEFYFRDSANAKMHLTFSPGAGVAGQTEVNSALKVQGNLGFHGKIPIAQQARPTDLAGVILVLANLGLTA